MAFNIKLKSKPSTDSCSYNSTVNYNTWQVFPAGTDTTTATGAPISVLAANALTNPLGDVTIATEGCDDVVVRFETYESADTTCTNCPPATSFVPQLVVDYAYIPAGSSITLPGIITDFDFVVIDASTGVPADDYAVGASTRDDFQVYVASCREVDICCPVPDITNGQGVALEGDLARIASLTP